MLRLCRALSLVIHFSHMPPQVKTECYTDLNRYAEEMLIKQLKLEEKIVKLENELKNKVEHKSYYK